MSNHLNNFPYQARNWLDRVNEIIQVDTPKYHIAIEIINIENIIKYSAFRMDMKSKFVDKRYTSDNFDEMLEKFNELAKECNKHE